MSNTQTELNATLQELESIPCDLKNIWANTESIRSHIERETAKLILRFSSIHLNPLELGHSIIFADARAQTELVTLRCSFETLTGSQEYQAADKVIRPLVDRIRKLEATIAEENLVAGLARDKRQREIEAAKASALAEVEAKFAEPALVRGRVKLPA